MPASQKAEKSEGRWEIMLSDWFLAEKAVLDTAISADPYISHEKIGKGFVALPNCL